VRFTEQAHWNTGVPIDVMLVPTQLIQAGLNVLSFGFLFWLWKRRAFAGQIILAYLILYSLERFVMDFWRADDGGSLLGCSVPRLIAIAVSIPAFTLMICLWWRARRSGELETA
jgi:phosphatidylglycerol:prolipoprotein diacylglycerol transferase